MTATIASTGPQIDVEEFFRTPRRTLAERSQAGKGLREAVPLAVHAEVPPQAQRRPALDILAAQERTRVQSLLSLRHDRMATDPFAFLRGAAAVMASDLSILPTSGIRVQLCGDAHVANFGMYASPERDLVFDLNDFDETLPGPFEWDVKRLAASVMVAGRQTGLKEKHASGAARAAAESYRTTMAALSAMPTMDMWYSHVDYAELLAAIKRTQLAKVAEKAGAKARSRTGDSAVAKLTEVVDGKRLFREEPPELVRVHAEHFDAVVHDLAHMYAQYLGTLSPDRLTLLLRFSFGDVAHKVVGVGSVGTRALVLLLESGDGSPLILQLKEAGPSVLEPYLKPSQFDEPGKRVVVGQHVMQTVSDPFLGWCRGPESQPYAFYVRQLRDMKGSIEAVGLDRGALATYAKICGAVLARAHARSGDPSLITGYLGQSSEFEDAVAQFAADYANLNDHDHAALVASLKRT